MEITSPSSYVFSHGRFSNCSSSSASFLLPLSDYYQRRQTAMVAAKCMKQNHKKKSIGLRPIELAKNHGFGSSMVVVLCAPPANANANATSAAAASVQERWLLEPVGDGDSRHIGSRVEMPGPFEIASDEVTVGRLPEEADMVISVATVSGLHAKIQKKEGNLVVTDLDSTNGTFIDDKRLRPGVAASVSSGSCITFGDTHLAMFRAFKLENAEPANEQSQEQTQENPEADAVS